VIYLPLEKPYTILFTIIIIIIIIIIITIIIIVALRFPLQISYQFVKNVKKTVLVTGRGAL
jgi:hypothetical protein